MELAQTRLFMMEKPNLTWMMTGGTPILGVKYMTLPFGQHFLRKTTRYVLCKKEMMHFKLAG